jgi:hypothetical protein
MNALMPWTTEILSCRLVPLVNYGHRQALDLAHLEQDQVCWRKPVMPEHDGGD